MRHGLVIALLVGACAAQPSRQQTQYADGRPHEAYAMRNGVRHGTARVWHAEGPLASEGRYVNGKREGRFVYFDTRGAFSHQIVYVQDEAVWRSDDPDVKPDVRRLSAEYQQRIRATLAPTKAMLPLPWFSSLDRTTSLARVGAELGVGGPSSLAFGSARRLDLFGNYTRRELGGYVQFSQTSLESMSGDTFSGRRTLEGGGTYQLPFKRYGTPTARLGILVPVGNDNTEGFLAGTAGAFQRPADAAASVPSTVAVRSSANFTRVGKRFVFQGDAGIDMLLGGEPSSFDALARANIAVGFGSRSALISAEVTNTLAVSDLDRRLHAFGLGGGARVQRFWLTGLLSYCVSGGIAATASVGYEL
jgi:hypothetical protein